MTKKDGSLRMLKDARPVLWSLGEAERFVARGTGIMGSTEERAREMKAGTRFKVEWSRIDSGFTLPRPDDMAPRDMSTWRARILDARTGKVILEGEVLSYGSDAPPRLFSEMDAC